MHIIILIIRKRHPFYSVPFVSF